MSVITGDYFIHENNCIVQGAQPINIDPLYVSKNSKRRWSFLNHLYVEHCLHRVSIPDPSGAILRYSSTSVGSPKKIKDNGKQSDEDRRMFNHHYFDHLKLMESSYNAGLSNCSNSEISGRLNIKNNQVLMNLNRDRIAVKCANGSIRNYVRYIIKEVLTGEFSGQSTSISAAYFYLKEETLPNNNKILYDYDAHRRLAKITTTNCDGSKNYSSVNIQYLNDQAIITSSDNKTMHYFFVNRDDCLLQKKVHFPEKPNETYEYIYDSDIKHCICQKNRPDGIAFHVEYYTRGTHVVNGDTIHIKDNSDPKLMRVKSIKSKTASNGEIVENYKFIYHLNQDPTSGYTESYDANNIKTIYRFSNLRLDAIEKYDENNVLKNKEIFSWGKGQDATKDVTFLLSKTFLNSENNVIFHKEFTYDQIGNIIKESFYGNLSGESTSVKFDPKQSFESNINNVKPNLESFSKYKTYTNDDRNLLLSEENDNQVKMEYTYIPGTDLIKYKIIKNKNEIKIRQFYEYNNDFVLVKEIIDDGQNGDVNDLSQVTQQLIKTITPKKENPFINMPEIIEEKYFDFEKNEEKLLKKTVLTYSDYGKVIREDIYNSKDQKEYSIERKYDVRGRELEEINPEGYKTTYDKYDDNFNLLKKIDPSGKITDFEYDFVNRLIKKEEISTEGNIHKTEFLYDVKSNVISTVDYLENNTNFEYDSFNNLTKTIKPYTKSGYSTIISEYDDMSRRTKTIDGNGNVTKTEYNAYNKPIRIIYADGSSERFIYNLNGTLKEHIDQIDTSTTYEFDFLQRDIKKTIESSDKKSQIIHEKNYQTFNLLSEKDFEGNITTYKYDYAGRKVLEKINDEETQFLYDDLSRPYATVFLDDDNSLFNIEVKDYLNRVIEERKEDKSHNVFYKIGYKYDSQNNKTKIIRNMNNQDSIEKFEYDSFNRLVGHEDASGIIDTIQYIEEKNGLQKKHIDPLGLETIETFDSLDRVITKEKFMGLELLSKEEFTYDLADNLTFQKSTVINQKDNSFRIIETKREYTEMNKEKAVIEAFNSKDQKKTKYSYTKKRQIAQIIKPNKIVLTYEYDFLNNNTRLFSSYSLKDHQPGIQESEIEKIDYSFSYNNLGQMLEAKNNITGLKTKRELDHKGRILKETLENSLTIENLYDKKGNRIKLILPDQTFIEYVYDQYYLKKIIRKDSSGFELYRHEYLDYDLDGNPLLQNLINDTHLLQDFDVQGRKIKVQNPQFTQTIDLFNPDGTINQMTYETQYRKDTSKFEYDFLKQLTKEDGLFERTYSYDSHNNRLEKNNKSYEINDVNQVIKTNSDELIYDANGNPKYKHGSDGDNITYKYDSLDRLTSIEKSGKYRLEFEYDAFHRRVFKKYFKFSTNKYSYGWQEKNNDKYLYDNRNEIAALDNQNNFKELRVLTESDLAEIGAAISLEIKNNIYTPIHDIQGNLSCAISENDAEIYRYSAFGEEKIFRNELESDYSKIKNNWRFSSKRKDESDLIYFGRRYYDSEYGRWLTPDPEGFKDGLNLYAFVLNDPLIKVDLYGLMSYKGEYEPQFLDKIGDAKDNSNIYLINGQFNTRDEAQKNGQVLYNTIQNINKNMAVIPMHTGTMGVVLDTLSSMLQKFGLIEPQRVRMIRDVMLKESERSKKNNLKAFFVDFSRAAIDIDQATKGLTKNERDQLIILNCGFAKEIPTDLGHIVKNIKSRNDPIPTLTHASTYIGFGGNFVKNLISRKEYNTFSLSDSDKVPLSGHSFANPTYQDYLRTSLNKLYPKFGVYNEN